ncbi:MAG: hypothetical protein KF817_02915 [Phycisphaeraceae bacterium]|nr:hypothetical protein [Phycisphaeraceae bacterium]
MSLSPELDRLITSATRRLRLAAALDAAASAAVIGLLVGVGLLCIDRLTAAEVPWAVFWIPAIAGAAAFALIAAVRPTDPGRAAARLDRHFDLGDRLASALATDRADPDIAAFVVMDAGRRSAGLRARDAIAIRVSRRWIGSLALAAALLLGALVVPHRAGSRADERLDQPRAAGATGTRAPDARSTEDGDGEAPESAAIDAAAEQLTAAARAADDAAIDELLAALERQFQHSDDPERAEAARHAIAADLADLAESLESETALEDETARRLSERFEGLDRPALPQRMQALADLLRDGRWRDAADHLDALAEEARDSDRPEAAEALARDLEALRESLARALDVPANERDAAAATDAPPRADEPPRPDEQEPTDPTGDADDADRAPRAGTERDPEAPAERAPGQAGAEAGGTEPPQMDPDRTAPSTGDRSPDGAPDGASPKTDTPEAGDRRDEERRSERIAERTAERAREITDALRQAVERVRREPREGDADAAAHAPDDRPSGDDAADPEALPRPQASEDGRTDAPPAASEDPRPEPGDALRRLAEEQGAREAQRADAPERARRAARRMLGDDPAPRRNDGLSAPDDRPPSDDDQAGARGGAGEAPGAPDRRRSRFTPESEETIDLSGGDAADRLLAEWFGPEREGAAGTDARDVAPPDAARPRPAERAARAAERAVEDARLPARHRDMIRRFFRALPSAAPPADPTGNPAGSPAGRPEPGSTTGSLP